MSKAIRIILIPLLLGAILGLFSFYGCGGGGGETTQPVAGGGETIQPGAGATSTQETTSAGELSQQQLQQILTNATTDFQQINTYKFDMDMDVIADVTGGSQSGKMTITATVSGAFNVVTNESQMTMEMAMDAEGMGEADMSESLTYDIYALADWLYMKMSYGGTDQWLKVVMSPELSEMLGLNTVEQQIEPLDSPAEIEYLRTESVDGVECYVLSVTPNMAELAQYLSEQNTGAGDMDWEDLVNSDVFKEFTYDCYIAKDTNYLKKIVVNMVMDFTGRTGRRICFGF